ncbi:MAG: cytochrome c, partial [bacterium]|nr:cytochrome c [bacterium]
MTSATAQSAAPDGQALYQKYCASCHGADLEGQPNWMERLPSGRLPAPPHDETGHTWHHSNEQLLRIVRDGLAAIAPGYETDMPAFGDMLSDQEIEAIL